jgi:hypothetical protein
MKRGFSECTYGYTLVQVSQNVVSGTELHIATTVNMRMKTGFSRCRYLEVHTCSGFSECRLRYRVVHINNSKYADEKRFLIMYPRVYTCSGFSECRLRYRVVHSNNSKYADEKRFLIMYLRVHTCSGFSECRLRYRVEHNNNS